MVSIIDQPYSKDTYDQIESKANWHIKRKVKQLAKHDFAIKMGAELEFILHKDEALVPVFERMKDTVKRVKKTHSEGKEVPSNWFGGFANFLRKAVNEPYGWNMLELTCGEFGPELLSKVVDKFRNYIITLAERNKSRVNFTHPLPGFPEWYTRYPDQHINFSLWEKGQNLFSGETIGRVASFVLNRLIDDTRDAAIIFACGDHSLPAIQQREQIDSFLEYSEQGHIEMLTRKDPEDPSLARIEFRKIADAPGSNAAKALLITASICDSLDYLIGHYSDKVASRGNRPLAEVLDQAIANETDDSEIMTKGQNGMIPREGLEEYRLRRIFEVQTDSHGNQVSGREAALARFRDSDRMKQLFGKPLHSLICSAKFPEDEMISGEIKSQRVPMQSYPLVDSPREPDSLALCS